MSKTCMNCGREISGVGKNRIFCDSCYGRVAQFLKFISTTNTPSLRLYDVNVEKLRGAGLNDRTLSYLRKCCEKYDEKRAAEAASTAAAAAASIHSAPIQSDPTAADVKAVDTAEIAPPPTDQVEASNETAVADADVGGTEVQHHYGDEFEDEGMTEDEAEAARKRNLIAVIAAAAVAFAIFLYLYLNGLIGGYKPDRRKPDNTDTHGRHVIVVPPGDDSDTDLPGIDTDVGIDTSLPPETDEPDTDPSESSSECVHVWATATCDEPITCTLCGATEGAPLGHNWKAADCEHPKTCTQCGSTDGAALGHDWKPADCEHPKTCSECGKTEGNPIAHRFVYSASAGADICEMCKKTEAEINGVTACDHKWIDATCTSPKTCSVCGEVDGNALSHDWKAADCEHPKTCTRCGATEGDVLGHDWAPADCEHPKTCARCGETEGEALGHTGTIKCSVCGKYLVKTGSIRTAYTDGHGFEVTVNELQSVEEADCTRYYIDYTIKNVGEDSALEGAFKLFYEGGSSDITGISFKTLEPDNSVTRTITLMLPKGAVPLIIEFYHDGDELLLSSTPHTSGALFWKP